MGRNLKNIYIEKLENLPNKLRFTEHVNSDLKVRRDSNWKRYYKTSPLFRICNKTIENSVGENFDDVYSKIVKLRKKYKRTDIYLSDLISNLGYLHTFKDEDFVLCYGRYFHCIPKTYNYDIHYIDKNNTINILKGKEYKKKTRLSKDEILNRKRAYKLTFKQKEERSLNMLSYLNNPHMYDYVARLYNSTRINLNEYERYKDKIQQKVWKYYKSCFYYDSPRYLKSSMERYYDEYLKSLALLNKINSGDYSEYNKTIPYEKECHHFEIPGSKVQTIFGLPIKK